MSRASLISLIVAIAIFGTPTFGQNPPPPIDVLPVFFVPNGAAPPTADQRARLSLHLEWSQARYLEMLGGRSTFRIARGGPHLYAARQPVAFYRKQPESSAPQFVSELVSDLGFDRYDCPHVLLVIVMNAKDDFPSGGGRPFNGGYDTGGGVVVLSSFALDQSPNFQSTLQHELGHAFGLPHSDVYGQDMRSGDSIMSYNPMHHTDLFKPSATPGILVPEDIRGLAMNQRAFAGLAFDARSDVPLRYELKPVVSLGPMTIPGQPIDPSRR